MNKFTKTSFLTESQLGIYLDCAGNPDSAGYILPLTFTFKKGEIDSARLAAAVIRAAECFSAFKTVIFEEKGSPVMALSEEKLPEIAVLKVSETEAQSRAENIRRPFSFDGNLLWRGEILETEHSVILALAFHHIIFDGTSIEVLNKAIARCYEGGTVSETATLFDRKAAEDAEENSPAAAEAREYFEKYMSGAETDSGLISDRDSGGKPNACGVKIYDCDLGEGDVLPFAKENGVTENIVFLSAFAYALAKFNNVKDVTFSSVEGGRFGGGCENSVGMFVKTFPLHFVIDEQMTSAEYVKAVKANFFDTLKHNHAKYSEITKDYPGCGNVKYVYEGDIFKGFDVGGASPDVTLLEYYKPVSDLDFLIYKKQGAYKLWMGFKAALYSDEMIDMFEDFLQTVLKEIISGKRLCAFNLVSPVAKAFMDGINATETDFDFDLTVNDMLEDVFGKYPDNLAVFFKNRRITYSELDKTSRRLAAYLSAKGLGVDDFVAVLIPRNEFTAITSVGITRAGAAYQPLDPSYPEERLNFMVKDSKAKMLIADRSLVHLLKDFSGDILYTDEIDALPEAPEFTPVSSPEGAFVLLYTSGTTGTPKGVILINRNVVAYCKYHIENFVLNEHSRYASVASFGFDASLSDTYSALLSGAALYLVPDEIKLDLPEVDKYYSENGITHGFMTTQLGRMFAELTKCKTLKYFGVGGEKLVPFTPPENFVFLNLYGPSESTAYICGRRVTDGSTIQPIGKPNKNIKFFITDGDGRLLPPCACGELCVAGMQVGRGYFERPEKTAESFVKNPFCDKKGYERLYKTGDIVRILPSGETDIIGRRDGQVKIRGFRIELTEVEQVIREYRGITNATVQAYDDPVSGKFTAAFIVSEKQVDVADLNAFIASKNPLIWSLPLPCRFPKYP